MFAGYREWDIDVPGATIHGRIGGDGEPVLLLHGYPQTHVMWHPLATALAESYRVVATDLRGYGDSVTNADDFTFRAMARDQVAVMTQLGYDRFHVIAHDRGARTAHRLALDHPDRVRSVVLLDILPTLDVWRAMDSWLAQRYYHWLFLAQPGGLAARLINRDPVFFLHSALAGLSGPSEVFHPDALRAYERAAQNPSVVAAWCGDYAAAAGPDLEHDRADVGRTLDIPCLVLWGSKGVVAHHLDPLETWRSWFPGATGHEIEAWHFLVEENPAAVLPPIIRHLEHA